MGPRPMFSVVVPAFNAEQRVAAVMGSVLAQTERDLELIVVDDGSADGTAERASRIAASDSRATVLTQPNGGTVAARNAGIAIASGRFLSFLDDDDLWLPDYLEAIRGAAELPGVGLVHTDAWVCDFADGSVGRRTAWARLARSVRRQPRYLESREAEIALLRVNFVTTCAATVSKQALETVGAFDPGIRGADEWDLWLRIVGAGFGIARVPAPHAVLRKRPNSISSDAALMANGSLLVLEKARRRGTLTSKADRVAARHAAVIRAELRAQKTGRRPVTAVAGLVRRIGRKRFPDPRGERREPLPADAGAALTSVLAEARGAVSEKAQNSG